MLLSKAVFFAVSVLYLLSVPYLTYAEGRQVEVTMEFNLKVPQDSKDIRLWVPYPVSDENQSIWDVKVTGNFSNSGVYREGENGNMILYAEWNSHSGKRVLTYTFKAKRKEVIKKDFPRRELPFSREEFKKYLKATSLGPTTGKVKEFAEKITKNKKTNLEKAKAIYNWIVNNMYRDPRVKGCGFGEVEKLLIEMGGKCADIHAVFVALSRSAGIPSREVYGIRIPKGKEGIITQAQHCWAEFYMSGYGWIPVDPSDVRKAMLEKKTTDPKDVKDLIEYFFGAIDENRIAYQTGRDIILNPAQKGEKLNYFMYPYAEVDGKMLNEDLFGFNIGYKISFKEI